MEIDSDRLRQLIQGHLNQCLTDDEFEALQVHLEGNPSARRKYVELSRLDAGLRDAGLVESPNVASFPSVAEESGVNWWAVAAVAMAFIFPLTMLFRVRSVEDSGPQLAAVRGVAVITAEAEAEWGRGDLSTGVALEPGLLVLEEGLAQIDFFGGASVSLSGPAELELINGDAAVLHRGTLKADVPPAARGFEVRTADVLLEDLEYRRDGSRTTGDRCASAVKCQIAHCGQRNASTCPNKCDAEMCGWYAVVQDILEQHNERRDQDL